MRTWSSRFLKTSVGVALAVLLVLVAAGGTHAMWNTRVEVPGAVIAAGNSEIRIDGPEVPELGQLFPGESRSHDFTVHNTGTVPLALRVDTLTWPDSQSSLAQQAFARALEVSIWPDAGTGCTTTPPVPAWTGTVPAGTGELGVTVESGDTQVMCLSATLAPDAPSQAQDAQIDLQLTVGGVQQ